MVHIPLRTFVQKQIRKKHDKDIHQKKSELNPLNMKST